jgi:acyl-CoA thioesterase-2
MPDVPPPEDLRDDAEVPDLEQRPGFAQVNRRERPFEMRSVFAVQPRVHEDDFRANPVWIRYRGVPPDDPALARCVLAYASDMGVVGTGSIPHRVPRFGLSMASLDHALWIHRAPPLDDWLLFAKRTAVAAHGRVLNRATFFARDGTVIASCAQEGVMRLADPTRRRTR